MALIFFYYISELLLPYQLASSVEPVFTVNCHPKDLQNLWTETVEPQRTHVVPHLEAPPQLLEEAMFKIYKKMLSGMSTDVYDRKFASNSNAIYEQFSKLD